MAEDYIFLKKATKVDGVFVINAMADVMRWVYDKNLPPPIRIGPNRILWDMQEILDWEQSRKESS